MLDKELEVGLLKVGFTEQEARIYVFLLKKGPQKVRDISQRLEIRKLQVYTILKELERKFAVQVSLDCPAHFSAISPSNVLQQIIKTKKKEMLSFETEANNILPTFNLIQQETYEEQNERFMIFTNLYRLSSKAQNLAEECQQEIHSLSGISNSSEARQLLDLVINAMKHNKNNFKIRFITSLNVNNLPLFKKIVKNTEKIKNFELLVANDYIGNLPRFYIRDSTEALFFLRSPDVDAQNPKEAKVLWTNNKCLVKSFEDLWQATLKNATEIHEKIQYLEKLDKQPEII